MDREKVIVGIEHCDKLGCSMCPYKPGGYSPMDCRIQLMRDALALLKEQGALLNKAYELLADMGLDFFCDDLMCDDGWCDEHCTTNGTTPECVDRWLRKQISEGR